MWETHNECSADLEKTRMANHGTDELMVVRSGALVEPSVGAGERRRLHLRRRQATRLLR